MLFLTSFKPLGFALGPVGFGLGAAASLTAFVVGLLTADFTGPDVLPSACAISWSLAVLHRLVYQG